MSDFDQVGAKVFQKHLWQCMIGQALNIKQNIEGRRQSNQFGIIVWQFNEIWPTGGWGSIEYGTVGYTKGQVLGGRWKPLQHWYAKTIYADVMATCGTGLGGAAVCYVTNDAPKPFDGTVTIMSVDFTTGTAKQLVSKTMNLGGGLGVKEFFRVGGTVNGTAEILHAVVETSTGEVVSENWVPFAAPKNMKLPAASVTFAIADAADPDGTVKVTVTSDKFALYVTLTTLAQGRFSDNAFCMTPGTTVLNFIPIQGFALDELKASTRIEHAAAYM